MIKFFQLPYVFLAFILLGGLISFLIFHVLTLVLFGFLVGGFVFIVLDMLARAFINS